MQTQEEEVEKASPGSLEAEEAEAQQEAQQEEVEEGERILILKK